MAGIAWGWWLVFVVVGVLLFVNRTTVWSYIKLGFEKLFGRKVSDSLDATITGLINTSDTYEAQYRVRWIKSKFAARWSQATKDNFDNAVLEAAAWDDGKLDDDVVVDTSVTVETLSAQVKALEVQIALLNQTGA